jgi:hypothetical protein
MAHEARADCGLPRRCTCRGPVRAGSTCCGVRSRCRLRRRRNLRGALLHSCGLDLAAPHAGQFPGRFPRYQHIDLDPRVAHGIRASRHEPIRRHGPAFVHQPVAHHFRIAMFGTAPHAQPRAFRQEEAFPLIPARDRPGQPRGLVAPLLQPAEDCFVGDTRRRERRLRALQQLQQREHGVGCHRQGHLGKHAGTPLRNRLE